MGGGAALAGPEFREGVSIEQLPEGGLLAGRVGDEAVVLAREGDRIYALGATCTHYGGPLAEGLVAGGTVRCPWHHAAFDLATGEPMRPPARDPIACWRVERRADRIVVAGPEPPSTRSSVPGAHPGRIVVVGGGAAGNAALETLRGAGFAGSLTLVGRDPDPPVDRPNLSKDYLAGTAPEEWIPLRGRDFYDDKKIDLRLGVPAVSIDRASRRLLLADGSQVPYDALLLAPGADPVRLPLPGADRPHVRTLRTLADSRALVAAAATATRAVVLGASFIGLEVAASLRARGLAVDVVAPESLPLERALGRAVGAFVRGLHEEHGVVFHLGQKPAAISDAAVTLENGASLAADLVVMGVGVRPATTLAEGAGLRVDRGILVDSFLRTADPAIWAAGDAARYPGPGGASVRIEHWVVAQRQGRVAARNMLGVPAPFRAVPFFWSAHFDVTIAYVGHAESWDAEEVDGSLDARDARVAYLQGARTLAVATVGRDRESLLAELGMEGAERSG